MICVFLVGSPWGTSSVGSEASSRSFGVVVLEVRNFIEAHAAFSQSSIIFRQAGSSNAVW
jgi:hypothetical protein